MKKIQLDSPIRWRAGSVPQQDCHESQAMREQLLREIHSLRVQLRHDTGAGTVLDSSRRQTYKEMINSRKRLYERLRLESPLGKTEF